MLSIQEREIAITIINALVEYGLTDHLAQYGEHCTEDWFYHNKLSRLGFGASGGATKSCIWHRDLENWVIKVAHTEHVKYNYATIEYENYIKACEAGLGRYFPETWCLGTFGGQVFYIQQRCDCDEGQVSSDWYERLRDEYDEEGTEYDVDCLWDEIDAMDDYEKAMLMFQDRELCDFLWHNDIGDLHEGNFGYLRGCPVIVDFSGFKG